MLLLFRKRHSFVKKIAYIKFKYKFKKIAFILATKA